MAKYKIRTADGGCTYDEIYSTYEEAFSQIREYEKEDDKNIDEILNKIEGICKMISFCDDFCDELERYQYELELYQQELKCYCDNYGHIIHDNRYHVTEIEEK